MSIEVILKGHNDEVLGIVRSIDKTLDEINETVKEVLNKSKEDFVFFKTENKSFIIRKASIKSVEITTD